MRSTTRLLSILGLAAFAITMARAGEKETPKPKLPFAVKVQGTGKPIVLIPGLTCSGAVWDSTVAHFKGKYECHVLTLGGFAGQPPVEGPFVDTMLKGIADYIRSKKLHKPVIVGHSLGAFMTFHLGATEPDLVGPLIAVDGLPCFAAMFMDNVTPEKLKEAEKFGQALGDAKREDFLKQQRFMVSMWLKDKAKQDLVAKWAEDSDQKTVGKAMAELMSRDLREEIAKIKTPVLLLAAPYDRKDEKTPGKIKDQLAKVRNKKVAFAPKAGHFIMFDEPEWMFKEMETFLAAAGPAPAGGKSAADLDKLKFLAGAWKGDMNGEPVEEHWTLPAGDNIMGMFRWVGKNGKTRVFELLTIHADAQGPTFRLGHFDGAFNPWKSELDKIPAFRLTEGDPSRALFSNPAADGGLKSIDYAVKEGKELHITVSFQDETRPALRFRLTKTTGGSP